MDETSAVVVLDGGLSTVLEQQGADLKGALWTARLVAEEPGRIVEAHRAFYAAGAQVVTTSTYQATIEGFVAGGYDEDTARRLIVRSVSLAQEARDEMAGGSLDLLVAASVGPYGAYLADGSEYRGNYGVTRSRLRDFHAARLALLAGSEPDLFAVETIPDAVEAEVLVELLDELGVPAWFCYSVSGAQTCAGQPLSEAYGVIAGSSSIVAAGVNCSDQDDVLAAVESAAATTGLPAIAYPNRGGSWDSVSKTWSYGAPLALDLVQSWVDAGARYVGGCCGTGPADIALIARRFGTA